jgi:hypothetical protein
MGAPSRRLGLTHGHHHRELGAKLARPVLSAPLRLRASLRVAFLAALAAAAAIVPDPPGLERRAGGVVALVGATVVEPYLQMEPSWQWDRKTVYYDCGAFLLRNIYSHLVRKNRSTAF